MSRAFSPCQFLMVAATAQDGPGRSHPRRCDWIAKGMDPERYGCKVKSMIDYIGLIHMVIIYGYYIWLLYMVIIYGYIMYILVGGDWNHGIL